MKDWIAMARANGLDLPPQEMDRIAQPLAALQEIFQPLVHQLTPEIEPASSFRMEEDD
jgi:hypothetical protein